MILSAAAIYFWNHMANRKLHFTHIFQYQEQVLYHILPAKKKIKMQGIVWMYSQIQSYMNANHLKLYLLKLFYSLIYIFEVFIFFFLSLACYNVISKRTNPLHLFGFFLPHHTTCGTSPNRDGTRFPASEAQCFNHWAAREVQAPSYQSRPAHRTTPTSQNTNIRPMKDSVHWF